MKYGLSEKQIEKIIKMLRSYPEVEEAILFGSRAIGTFKEASDVDIAVKGNKVTSILADKIKFDIEEDTYLPFFFDIISYPSITNEDLKKHINTKGISIYRAGWKKCRLGDVIELHNGKNPNRDKEYGQYPIYGGNGILGYHKEYNHSDETVIIGRVGAYCGCVYYCNKKIWVSDNAISIKAKSGIDLKYLFYFLRNLNLNNYAEGSSQPLLMQNLITEINIFIPPIHKQKEIASILSSLDDKIDLLYRQNKTLESIAQTLFHQWFIKEADEKWEKKPLGDVVDLRYGKSLTSKRRTNFGFPVIGSSGIIGYHSEFLVKGPGIIIGRKGTIGKTTYIDTSFYPIDTTYYVVKKLKTSSYYFEYFLLKTLNLFNFNSDSAVPGLNRNSVLSMKIALPDIDRINLFNEKVYHLFKKRTLNDKQISKQNKLKQILLIRLLNMDKCSRNRGINELR